MTWLLLSKCFWLTNLPPTIIWFDKCFEVQLNGKIRENVHNLVIIEIYSHTVLAKISWKQFLLIKKLLESWFDEISLVRVKEKLRENEAFRVWSWCDLKIRETETNPTYCELISRKISWDELFNLYWGWFHGKINEITHFDQIANSRN